jgi:hypothetical protein
MLVCAEGWRLRLSVGCRGWEEEACGFVSVAVNVCTDVMMLSSNHRLLNVRVRPSVTVWSI